MEPPRPVSVDFPRGKDGDDAISSTPTIHFRHYGRANVLWTDGHVTSEKWEWAPETNVYFAAIAYTPIETAKPNGIDPQVWLSDTVGRISDHAITRLDELMPWRYALT